jgi:uncharacterized protein
MPRDASAGAGPPQPAPAVVDNPGAERFELRADGAVAFLRYARSGDRLRLIHTEVPPPLRGRGYGNELARAGLEHARTHGLRVVPICPVVRAYLKRHAEYLPVVGEAWRAQVGGGG